MPAWRRTPCHTPGSAFKWPLKLSIHAWSPVVPGRPKCWAMAHMAMSSLVEPELIWGPLNVRHRQTRGIGRACLGAQSVGEDDLDLGGGLLRLGEVGDLERTGQLDRIIAALRSHTERQWMAADEVEGEGAPSFAALAAIAAHFS